MGKGHVTVNSLMGLNVLVTREPQKKDTGYDFTTSLFRKNKISVWVGGGD